MTSPGPRAAGLAVAVVGATGAVGREMISLLSERRLPLRELRALASPRSAGERIPFAGGHVAVEVAGPDSFRGMDLVLFSAGREVSRALAPAAMAAGAVVIDNSSAFRLHPDVPLVVPEVNPEAIPARPRLIANPNCTTIIASLPLHALHRAFGLRRVIAATYQAASGAGARGMAELQDGVRGALGGGEPPPSVFPRPLAFNVIPWIGGGAGSGGDSEEEAKLDLESRKILGLPDLEVTATCVRVPVLRAHAVAITAFFDGDVSIAGAREALQGAPGIEVDGGGDGLPTPRDAAGRDPVLVGRLRVLRFDPRGLAFFCAGDQIRKGAALNALQIAERLPRM